VLGPTLYLGCRRQIPILICPFARGPDAAGGSVGENEFFERKTAKAARLRRDGLIHGTRSKRRKCHVYYFASLSRKIQCAEGLRGVMIFLVLFLSRKKEQTNVLKRKLRSEGSRVYHLIGRSLMRRSASAPLDFLESRQKVTSRPSGPPLAKIARRAISSLVRARDCYGNQFTPELPRAAAGLRTGRPTRSANGIFYT
jgi:hypothetical protein